MKIVRKTVIQNYEDLSVGDVFTFVEDATIVCIVTECGAISLESGCSLLVNDDEKVQKLDAELVIK